MDWMLVLVVAALLTGAVSIFMGIRGLQTGTIRVSAFAAKALHGPAARRLSLACIAVGVALMVFVVVMMELFPDVLGL
jgi:hypothetical protein